MYSGADAELGQAARRPERLELDDLAALVDRDPDDRRLLGDRGGYGDDLPRAQPAQIADRAVGQIEVPLRPVGKPDRKPVETVAPAGEHDRAGVEHGIARDGELPLRLADLGLDLDKWGHRAAGGAPGVEVPPAGAIADEGERPVGQPLRLLDRLLGPPATVV